MDPNAVAFGSSVLGPEGWVLGHALYDAQTRTLAWTPQAPLTAGATYTMEVHGFDALGTMLPAPYPFSFTTAPAPAAISGAGTGVRLVNRALAVNPASGRRLAVWSASTGTNEKLFYALQDGDTWTARSSRATTAPARRSSQRRHSDGRRELPRRLLAPRSRRGGPRRDPDGGVVPLAETTGAYNGEGAIAVAAHADGRLAVVVADGGYGSADAPRADPFDRKGRAHVARGRGVHGSGWRRSPTGSSSRSGGRPSSTAPGGAGTRGGRRGRTA